MENSHLRENPFFVLGVSPRASARELAAACDAKTLDIDAPAVQRARTSLAQPKARLAAEVRWLLGLAPSRAHDLVRRLESEPTAVRESLSGLTALARCNIAADLAVRGVLSAIEAIRLVADEYHSIDAAVVVETVNEDRAVAGVPKLQDVSLVREELSRRANEIADVLTTLLERENDADVKLAELLEQAAVDGDELPEFLHLVTDRYQLHAQRILDECSARVRTALETLRRTVATEDVRRPETIGLALMGLENAVRRWDRAAQPLQLLARSKGLADEASIRLAKEVRSAAIEIANEHGLHEEALTITNLLSEAFQEVPHVIDIVDEDRDTLEDIVNRDRVEQDLEAVWPAVEAVRTALNTLREVVGTKTGPAKADGNQLAALRKAVLSWKEAASSLDSTARVQDSLCKINETLATELRSLAIDLANDHQRHQDARILLEFTLQEFGESESIAGKLREDVKTLGRIIERKRAEAAEAARWRKENSLELMIGNDRLVMTPEKIQYNAQTIATGSVDRVRYGVFKHYVNGIRVSREFTIWVGTARETIKIECVRFMEKEQVVSERMGMIIGKLWGLVGARLAWEMLTTLSEGKTISVGSQRITQNGIWLTKRHWFSSEPFFSQWTDLRYTSGAGTLILMSDSEPKAKAELSYRDVDNVHILEHVLQYLWKDGNYAKLERGEFVES